MESYFIIIYLAAKVETILHGSANAKCWIHHVSWRLSMVDKDGDEGAITVVIAP